MKSLTKELVEANEKLISHWNIIRGPKETRNFLSATDYLLDEIEKILLRIKNEPNN